MVLPVDKFMRLRLRREPRRFGEDEEPDVPNQAPAVTRRPGRWPLKRRKPKKASGALPEKDDDALP